MTPGSRGFHVVRPGWVWVAAWCGVALAAGPAAAHPVSVSRAYVYVSPEQATVRLEVFLEDLLLFHNLRPNQQDFLEPDAIRRGIELHKQFLAERFVVRDVSGNRLAGKLTEVKLFEMPDEGVPLAELMAHTLTYQFQFVLEAPPEFLTFSQQFTDEEGIIPSEMKLVLKQENAGTVQTAELRPGDVETVRLSWTNPPLSPEASEEERAGWLERQKEETLGITSYSSVYSFLYIERHEVRHEILIPLLTLEESVLIARDDDEILDLAEQDAARQQIEAYFRSGNPLEIDGRVVEPVVERCDFYGLDFKDFAQRAERREVGLASARVGIILTYPTTSVPQSVRLTWNRFNNYVWAVNMVVFAFDDVTKKTLSRLGNNAVFEWSNPGYTDPPRPEAVPVRLPPPARWSVPLVSVGCLLVMPLAGLVLWLRGVSLAACLLVAGGLVLAAVAAWPLAQWETADPWAPIPRLSPDEARQVFAQLHRNTYRAFEYQAEDDVYDALATSVAGELHRQLYLQIRRGLEMQEQGGAISRIRDVTLLEGSARPLPPQDAGDARGFRYRCRWDVAGTVEHWGHIHARTNQYEAEFAVEPREDSWKITQMEVLNEQRVKFETRLRGL